MSKKENVKNAKPYTKMNLLKDFVVIAVIVLYVTLRIGDEISEASSGIAGTDIATRYIPIAIVTLIATFLTCYAKVGKFRKSEEKEVKKTLMIAPAIVTVILFIYGMYSVAVNVSSFNKNDLEVGSIYLEYYEEIYGVSLDDMIAEARNEAIMNWAIIAAIYLIEAEGVVFLITRNLNKKLKEDEVLEQSPEDMLDSENPTEAMVTNSSSDESTQVINNINWNL